MLRRSLKDTLAITLRAYFELIHGLMKNKGAKIVVPAIFLVMEINPVTAEHVAKYGESTTKRMTELTGWTRDMKHVKMFFAAYATSDLNFPFEEKFWETYASQNNISTDNLDEYFALKSHFLHCFRARLLVPKTNTPTLTADFAHAIQIKSNEILFLDESPGISNRMLQYERKREKARLQKGKASTSKETMSSEEYEAKSKLADEVMRKLLLEEEEPVKESPAISKSARKRENERLRKIAVEAKQKAKDDAAKKLKEERSEAGRMQREMSQKKKEEASQKERDNRETQKWWNEYQQRRKNILEKMPENEGAVGKNITTDEADEEIVRTTIEQAQKSSMGTENAIYSQESYDALIKWYTDNAPKLDPAARTFHPSASPTF